MNKVIALGDTFYKVKNNEDSLSVNKIESVWLGLRSAFVADDDMIIAASDSDKSYEVKKGDIVFILYIRGKRTVVSVKSEELTNFIEDDLKEREEAKKKSCSDNTCDCSCDSISKAA